MLDKLFNASAEFFQLSETDKQEIQYDTRTRDKYNLITFDSFKKSPIFRGYEPLAAFAETAAEDAKSDKKPGDLKEAFNFGYERAADPQFEGQEESAEPMPINAMTGDNVWPVRQPLLQSAVFACKHDWLFLLCRLTK